jgi:hypothetical protein
MRSFLKVLAVAAAIAIPALSQAQTNSPLTRAEVREQLVQLENAGYNPNLESDYPNGLRRAEAIVARQHTNDSAYGGETAGATQSGR